MTEHEDHRTEGEEEVIVEQGRLVGSWGQVLIALLVLAILFAILA